MSDDSNSPYLTRVEFNESLKYLSEHNDELYKKCLDAFYIHPLFWSEDDKYPRILEIGINNFVILKGIPEQEEKKNK